MNPRWIPLLAGIISKVNDSPESVIQAVAEMNELIGGNASTGV